MHSPQGRSWPRDLHVYTRNPLPPLPPSARFEFRPYFDECERRELMITPGLIRGRPHLCRVVRCPAFDTHSPPPGARRRRRRLFTVAASERQTAAPSRRGGVGRAVVIWDKGACVASAVVAAHGAAAAVVAAKPGLSSVLREHESVSAAASD